jgi:hypothetical protein
MTDEDVASVIDAVKATLVGARPSVAGVAR